MIFGFVWASRTWQGPWEFDPKIVATLVTWLIYLTLFSTRMSGNWRGRRSAYGAVFGLPAAVLVTFPGRDIFEQAAPDSCRSPESSDQ